VGKKVGLKEIAYYISTAHVKLDLSFLKKLLKDASKSENPAMNLNFAKKLKAKKFTHGHGYTTVRGWISGRCTIPMSKLIIIINLSKRYFWSDVEKNLEYIKAGPRRGQVKIQFPLKINKSLGSVIGYVLGDGSIDKRFHAVFFSNKNKELLQDFSDKMFEIFNILPRIWVQKKRKFHEKTIWSHRVYSVDAIPSDHCAGLFYPKICADIFYSIFGKFAEGKQKIITRQINESNSSFKQGLVSGFFDAEGSAQSENYSLRFVQDDKTLLKGIQLILKKEGIKTNPIHDYFKNDKIRHYFNITSLPNYYRFYKKIGCISSQKNKELEKLIDKVSHSNKFKNKYDPNDFVLRQSSGSTYKLGIVNKKEK